MDFTHFGLLNGWIRLRQSAATAAAFVVECYLEYILIHFIPPGKPQDSFSLLWHKLTNIENIYKETFENCPSHAVPEEYNARQFV